MRDGETVDPTTWTKRVRTGAVTVDDAVDPDRVLDEYAAGATVVLQSLQRWWPPVTRFCRDLETTLTHAVQANAYLTGPDAVGLAPHHDTHDVFVLQIHGTKHWVVREPLVDAPLRRHRSEPDTAGRQPVLFETELRPGTCMYLPRGVVHSARAQAGSSLHLTIGVLATTAADVVRLVGRLAGDDPALRRTLPLGWAHDPAVAVAAVKGILDELVEFTAGLDASDLAGRLTDGFVTSRRGAPQGRLLDLERSTSIDDDTIVVRRETPVSRIDEVDGRLRIRTADRTVESPAVVGPVVHRLFDGHPRRVGELADLADAESRVVLVRRLVREGLLRIVPDGSDVDA